MCLRSICSARAGAGSSSATPPNPGGTKGGSTKEAPPGSVLGAMGRSLGMLKVLTRCFPETPPEGCALKNKASSSCSSQAPGGA